ncbi:hypothetical protein ACYJW8_03610 [Frateuria aurantia]
MRSWARAWLPAALMLLSGCSLWPWHKHHREPEPLPPEPATAASSGAASLPAPPASVAAAVTPASSASSGSVDVAAPAATNVPADAATYAPFSKAEWQQLWSWYGPLAHCTDQYMSSAGINGQLLGVNLVQQHQAGQVIADARVLLGDELPPLADNAPAAAQAALASKAIWLLMQDRPAMSLGQVLARKALARYDLALVAGPACPLDSGYHSLLAKALH